MKMRVLPLMFLFKTTDENENVNLYVFFMTDKKRQCYPLCFIFMITNKKQHWQPLCLFSWRPIKNNSVTPYVLLMITNKK